jgi:hypothetical protein
MTQLGPQPTWLGGHNGCTFNPDPPQSPVGDCGEPSTHHIRLRGDDGFVAACSVHTAFALAELPILDWHTWMAWCNMPGSIWYPSPTPDEADSYCALDGGGEKPALVGAEPMAARGGGA